MTRYVILALAAAVAALGSFSSAARAGVRLALPDGTQAPQPYQSWADRAAAPAAGQTVTLHIAACPGGPSWAGGCALPPRGEVYMLPHAAGPHVLFHELGHMFDAGALRLDHRHAFRRIVGLRRPWAGPPEGDPPIEQFAEAYSLCARRPAIAEREFGMYGYAPTPGQHRRVCALIRRASGRAGGH